MATRALSSSARPAGSSPSPLTTSVVREGTRIVIVLQGEADLSTRPVLAEALSQVTALPDGDFVIDLAQLDFIDTASVRALARCQQVLHRRGGKLTFRSPSRIAARMLVFFGLTDQIDAGA